MAETLNDRRTVGASQIQGRAPWVLIAGGFHMLGGMDKANAALAAHLLARGHRVHLVAHKVSEELSAHANARLHLVARPASSYLLGEQLLERRGRKVAAHVTARHAQARVVTNGGNCPWPDINWVHSVHHAWPTADAGAPLWFRVKNRAAHALACRRERRAFRMARVLIANSERTRRDIIERVGVDAHRIHTVYLGSDGARGLVTPEERSAARASLGLAPERTVVAFAGALGHDRNKGFDTLWRAWQKLSARGGWDADLLVAGAGRGLAAWRARVAGAGLAGRVSLIGFTEKIDEVYAAADLLVSPARYEAYGLNVHEAICRGVPSIVSGSAGVAEQFAPELGEMLLEDAADAEELAARLARWRADAEGWKRRFRPFASRLRAWTWEAMAAEMVARIEAAEDGRRVVSSEHLLADAGRRVDSLRA